MTDSYLWAFAGSMDLVNFLLLFLSTTTPGHIAVLEGIERQRCEEICLWYERMVIFSWHDGPNYGSYLIRQMRIYVIRLLWTRSAPVLSMML